MRPSLDHQNSRPSRQIFTTANETGWHEERIRFIPLVQLARHQHRLQRHNGVRTHRSGTGQGGSSLHEQLEALRRRWVAQNRDGSQFRLAKPARIRQQEPESNAPET